MCVVLLAINQHPYYPIIILSNRDEFYTRASLSAHFWHENPNIFAGKDLVEGGTWIGVNTSGSFAFVTNYRDPRLYQPLKVSRGLIVKNFLSGNQLETPRMYIEKIAKLGASYNPFNVVVGSKNESYYYSNINNKIIKLVNGVYAISNHLLDTPWQKVERLKEMFNEKLNALLLVRNLNSNDTSKILLNILSDKELAPQEKLPKTGVSHEIEMLLSSIFVRSNSYDYGTISSTAILFEKNENIIFSENAFKMGILKSNLTTVIPICESHF